ncbi:MAG TPA: hypothetical protein VI489_06290 [Candidatus Brocadiaceae bacterium]
MCGYKTYKDIKIRFRLSGGGYVGDGGYIDDLEIKEKGSTSSTPTGTIVINSGDTYTESESVTFSLSATDTVVVVGYYLSTSATTHSASGAGWTDIASTE